MRYLIRSVKYFLYISVIFSVVLWILACLSAKHFISDVREIADTLVHGWGSVGLILAVFAAVAAIYPLLGYAKMRVAAGGSVNELKDSIDDFMTSRGYVFEKQSDESLCYRLASGAGRITRTWEDRITVSQGASGLTVEGLRKDVARIASGLETRLGANKE